MKVLHAAYMAQFEPGILKQMEDEQEAAQLLNLDWMSRLYCPAPGGTSPVLIPAAEAAGRSKRKREYYRFLATAMEDRDILLLRHTPYEPWEWNFIRHLHQPVFTMHHTMEGPEIRLTGGIVAKLKSILEEILFKSIAKRIAGVVAVTPEIARYECNRGKIANKPVFIYPNGILPPTQVPQSQPGEIPEFLFVASCFTPWQGLDRLAESVSPSREPCCIHLVGTVPPPLLRRVSAEPRFHCHGRLTTKEIQTLSTRCCLGLSSLALDRKNMREACPLKVREYLALGLPVYGNYRESFSPDFPYYRQGEAKLDTILNFAKEMSSISRQKVRDESMPQIEKQTFLKQLHNSLLEVV